MSPAQGQQAPELDVSTSHMPMNNLNNRMYQVDKIWLLQDSLKKSVEVPNPDTTFGAVNSSSNDDTSSNKIKIGESSEFNPMDRLLTNR